MIKILFFFENKNPKIDEILKNVIFIINKCLNRENDKIKN